MEITPFINGEQREVLAKARETYGDTAQILVSNEELCELAAVCAKYPRYKTKEKAKKELYSKALDEVSDVLIILDHVVNIFELSPDDIQNRIAGKVARVSNWLSESNSMEQTTIDRTVPTVHNTHSLNCKDCEHYGDYKSLQTDGACLKCVQERILNRG